MSCLHPSDCVCAFLSQAYMDTLQTQWSWLLQITKCIDVHLKENAAYSQVAFKYTHYTHIAIFELTYTCTHSNTHWQTHLDLLAQSLLALMFFFSPYWIQIQYFILCNSSSKRPMRPTLHFRRNMKQCVRSSPVTRTQPWKTFWTSSGNWK